jgi:hypothetical protein
MYRYCYKMQEFRDRAGIEHLSFMFLYSYGELEDLQSQNYRNDLLIQFVCGPRLGNVGKIPPINNTSMSAVANRSLYAGLLTGGIC